MKDMIQVIGRPTIRLYDKDGNLKQSLHEDNLVVQDGKDYFIRKVFEKGSGDTSAINTFSAGTGTTAAALSDSELENQIGTTSISEYIVDENEITLFGGFIQGVATGTISELGVLTNNSTLISRIVVSTPFEKTSTDFLNVNWKIQIG